MRLESTFEAGDEGFPLNSELVTDGQYFFFAIDRALMRCDIDGGNPLIIQVPNVSFPELSSVNISTIATADGQVYWCDNNNEGIYRCDLDGGNPELFLDLTTAPLALEYDPATNSLGTAPRNDAGFRAFGMTIDDDHLFWSDAAQEAIYRVNRDGSNPEIWVDGHANFDQNINWDPAGIVHDSTKIYWLARDDLHWANKSGITLDANKSTVFGGSHLAIVPDPIPYTPQEGSASGFDWDLRTQGPDRIWSLTIEWYSVPGNSYSVERSIDMNNWEVLATVAARANETTTSYTEEVNAPESTLITGRFFRVVVQ